MFADSHPQGLGRWRQFSAQFHDLIFPPRCLICQAIGHELCPGCAQQVIPAAPPLCDRCGRLQESSSTTCALCRRQPHAPQMTRAAAIHSGVMREAIHALKYGGATSLASSLARYLYAAWDATAWDALREQVDLVAPVPLHADRLQERGYNQSALLAEAFCRQSNLTFHAGALSRVRSTQSQVGLDAQARALNVADAFQACTPLDDATVLIIDDVYTTGSTLAACTKAAQDAGARAVVALTLALPRRG